MAHLTGTMNAADSLTKALTATLAHRHNRRAMGHYNTLFSDVDFGSQLLSTTKRLQNTKVGEDVRADSVRVPSLLPGDLGHARTARSKDTK